MLHKIPLGAGGIDACVELALPRHEDDAESCIVLAGDIACKLPQLEDTLFNISQRFKYVVYVPGNHEFYDADMLKWFVQFEAFASGISNLHYGAETVQSFVLDGVRFVVGTLWAHGGHSLYDMGRVGSALVDFRAITLGQRRFSVPIMREINRNHSEQIWKFLSEDFGGKTVVVTHHLPMETLCHPRFGSELNGGFASIEDSHFNGFGDSSHNPDFWIFGHTHDTIDTEISGTRFLCNPKGYPGEHRDQEFNTYDIKTINV